MSKAWAKTLDRALALDIVRVTEGTAVAAALWRGRGNEAAADEAAAAAMYKELERLPIDGVVVVGEGNENETPLLYIGETVSSTAGTRLKVDLAVDPIEGSTLCAKALPNALSVLAVAERGGLLKVPDIYMDKVAIGPGYPEGLVDLDATPADNLKALALAKNVPVGGITVCILDTPKSRRGTPDSGCTPRVDSHVLSAPIIRIAFQRVQKVLLALKHIGTELALLVTDRRVKAFARTKCKKFGKGYDENRPG